ncbi:Protoporphyrinogen oxidase [Paragonimus heterotremus]|uniref:Protoporphyrinogen oxidase n=1 Tax=Paragonimus heterotremus TaxID=100268 RepID=A0A8J4STK8_9TREM|nr:Protoporphyrinogen oxidase [Paragonimus heterotremus]
MLGILKNSAKLRSTHSVALPDVIDCKLPNTSSIVPSRTFAWSLQGGMQTLTVALCSRLRSAGPCVTMHTNVPVCRIQRSGDRFTVHWSSDTTTEAMIEDVDAVFLTCSSYNSTGILSGLLPPRVIKRLKREQLPWASVAVAIFEMDGKSAQPPVRGFGHLVPSTEDEHALGVVYDSVAFPQLDGGQQSVRYTVMMRPYSCWLNSDRCPTKEIEGKALDILKKHLSLSSPLVIASNIQLHRDCIPQYPLGHVENVKSVRSEISELIGRSSQQSTGIHLVGFSYDGVGLGDAVTSALKAVSAELQLSA